MDPQVVFMLSTSLLSATVTTLFFSLAPKQTVDAIPDHALSGIRSILHVAFWFVAGLLVLVVWGSVTSGLSHFFGWISSSTAWLIYCLIYPIIFWYNLILSSFPIKWVLVLVIGSILVLTLGSTIRSTYLFPNDINRGRTDKNLHPQGKSGESSKNLHPQGKRGESSQERKKVRQEFLRRTKKDDFLNGGPIKSERQAQRQVQNVTGIDFQAGRNLNEAASLGQNSEKETSHAHPVAQASAPEISAPETSVPETERNCEADVLAMQRSICLLKTALADVQAKRAASATPETAGQQLIQAQDQTLHAIDTKNKDEFAADYSSGGTAWAEGTPGQTEFIVHTPPSKSGLGGEDAYY